MKVNQLFGSALLTGALLFTACSEDNGGEDINTSDYSEVLSDYVDNTVIPTYADMKDNAILLYTEVSEFHTTSEQEDLNAACEYWKTTRAPWERSEAFLFGPAAYNSLDPLLDSWPLDQAQLEQVLDGNQQLTADFVREGLGAVLRGFHTVEYLLFREGQNRAVSDFSNREKDYLLAVTQVLRDDCIMLWALWNGVEPGTLEAEAMESLDVDVTTPYKNEFMNAGQAGSRYTAQRDAVDEILQGIMDIADEVANGKLADPYTTKDVLVVESWHSWNSLTDFKNNIHSIQNAYTSSYDETGADNSISDLVAAEDEDLDTRVKEKIQAALTALDQIPEPFRNNLNDDETVPAAMTAINELFTIFEGEVKPTVLD